MKKVNDMTVFESSDKCSLDEYSEKMATEVPKLIKKAKEETNQKVIEISENDIKQDNEIATLKNNYTKLQEQNTKLEEQIKKDRENMINLEVEGQSIHVEDSSDLEGQLEALGNVEQQTNLYTGKLEQGTINQEGEVSTTNRVRTVDFIKVTSGIKIPVRVTGADKFAFATYDNNKKFTSIIGTWTNVGESIVIPSNVNYIKIILGKNNDSNIAVSDITNFVVGNLPSPEYPSEIRAVGDNVNLLENKAKTTTVNGVTFTVNEDGSVIANGTATNVSYIDINTFPFIKNNDYVLSGCPDGGNDNSYKIYCINVASGAGLTNDYGKGGAIRVGTDQTGTIRIRIASGYKADNLIFKPKLEKGTEATSYSKFGQGSVEIKKQNKNIMPINTEFYELTSNGIKNKSNSRGKSITEFKIKKGKTLKLCLLLFSKPSVSSTFTVYLGGREVPNMSFTELQSHELNKKYERTFTTTEDTNIIITLWGNVNKEIFEFQFWAEINNITEYTEHQEQTKILPIQKPMLRIGNTRDIFIKKEGKWYERHFIHKVIFNGTESWAYNKSGGNFAYRQIDNNTQYGKNNEILAISNYLKPSTFNNYNKTDNIVFAWSTEPYICIRATNSIASAETTKVWIKKLYDSGNPLIIYRTLITPTDLLCTPEQIEILDELDNFQTYKPITNITTDSIAKLKLKYIADTKTYVDNKVGNLENQVNVINELLSTTKTSSVLLDNLQTDIEREVL